MAYARVFELEEANLRYQATRAPGTSGGTIGGNFNIATDSAAIGGNLAAETTAALTGTNMPETPSGARTITFTLKGIRCTQLKPTITPTSVTHLVPYEGHVKARAIGVFLDGTRPGGDVWTCEPIALGV